MHSIRTLRLATLGAALVLGTATVVAAQPPARARAGQMARGHRARQPQGGRQQLRRSLFRGVDLSLAQRRQIRDIGLKYGDQREDLALALRKQAGTTAGQRPDSATRARLRTQLQTQNRALMDRQLADLRNVLTPAQRTAFDSNVTRVRERMQGRTDRALTGAGRDGRAFDRGAFRERRFRDRAFRRGE
jgi:Spy/CpxP family protein refolding chaperone